MNVQTLTYMKIDDHELKMDFYRAVQNRKEKTIIYIHGGGLIYGTRKDLPEEYITLFLESGYDFLTLDYPFYPETDVFQILHCVQNGINWFIQNGVSTLNLIGTDYILFGRSAGAYLAIKMVSRMEQKPAGLISLYGYFDLTDEKLTGPSAHYLTYPFISRNLVEKLIQPHVISEISPQKRFMLYMHLRQTGTWLLLKNENRVLYSLDTRDLENFPRTFIAFSTTDQDVPCNQSRKMAKYIPEAEIFEVDHQEHDFDRDPKREVSKDLYRQILKWLLMNEEMVL